MGESSAVEHVGLRIPSAPMICWVVFIAALAYSFTGCLGSASPTTPHMAPKDMNDIINDVRGTDFLFHYTLSPGSKIDNTIQDRNDVRVSASNDQRIPSGDLRLETLLRQKFVLGDDSRDVPENARSEKRDNVVSEKGDSVSAYDIPAPIPDNVVLGVGDHKDSSLPSKHSATEEVHATSSTESHSSRTRSLSNLVVNNETTDSNNTDVAGSISETGFVNQEMESDSLKHLIQNTVLRLETSLDDLYHRELKSEILNFMEFDDGDDENGEHNNINNNTSNETLSSNDSPPYPDLTDYNDDGDNNDNTYNNERRYSADSSSDDEDEFNFLMDHLRDEYTDHATYAILHALETRTIPHDMEFWKSVSKFLDTPTYLRRSKRRTRSSRWRSRRYQEWQRRRRQNLRARMSITYSHVVPCAFSDRFYCTNGGTCVFVEALDIKTCRCPIGYTGVRCELIDREYILTLLTNQLIFS